MATQAQQNNPEKNSARQRTWQKVAQKLIPSELSSALDRGAKTGGFTRFGTRGATLASNQENVRTALDRAGSREINQRLQDLGEDPLEQLTEPEIEELKGEMPDRPRFPIGILALAIVKDLVDFFSLGVIGTIINVFIFPVLFIWTFKGGTRFIRKTVISFVVRTIIEMIPFINLVPLWTMFVLRTHARHYKRIDNIITMVEGVVKDFVNPTSRFRSRVFSSN